MPLVRIDVQQGRTPAELRKIADVVQGVMLDVFAAPPGDRYQIITEHPVGQIIAEDTGLGFERTDGVVVIQIVQQGRTTEQKKAAYEQLAKRLEAECDVAAHGPDRLGGGERPRRLVLRAGPRPVPGGRPVTRSEKNDNLSVQILTFPPTRYYRRPQWSPRRPAPLEGER